jgi:hypothetical protein
VPPSIQHGGRRQAVRRPPVCRKFGGRPVRLTQNQPAVCASAACRAVVVRRPRRTRWPSASLADPSSLLAGGTTCAHKGRAAERSWTRRRSRRRTPQTSLQALGAARDRFATRRPGAALPREARADGIRGERQSADIPSKSERAREPARRQPYPSPVADNVLRTKGEEAQQEHRVVHASRGSGSTRVCVGRRLAAEVAAAEHPAHCLRRTWST